MAALLLLGGSICTANAATLSVSPANGTYAIGQTFAVTVRVNTQGEAINAVEAVLRYDPSILEGISLSTDGSIFDLNFEEPSYSNSTGNIEFAGIILNPGFSGSTGTLVTVSFRTLREGATKIEFVSGAVLANDGQGTNVTSSLNSGTYGVIKQDGGAAPTPVPESAPTPTPAEPTPVRVPGQPEVTSATHPNPAVWYSNARPEFSWPLPEDVTDVSYFVSTSPDADPGNVTNGVIDQATFADLDDGQFYFHIKFRIGETWGPVAHYPFRVDATPPSTPIITRLDADPTEPRPTITFSSRDAISSVRFLLSLGGGPALELRSGTAPNAFQLPHLDLGTWPVTVSAVDDAGNLSSSTINIVVEPLESPTIMECGGITGPVIQECPTMVRAGAYFRIAGSADTFRTVTIRAVRDRNTIERIFFGEGENVVSTVAYDGTWAVAMRLDSGTWLITATTTDDRGASSLPSEPVRISATAGFSMDLLSRLTSLRWQILVLLGITVMVAIWRISLRVLENRAQRHATRSRRAGK